MKRMNRRAWAVKLLALLLCSLLLLSALPAFGARTQRRKSSSGSLNVVIRKDIYNRLPEGAQVVFTLYRIGDPAPGTAAGWKINDDLARYRIIEASTSEELGKAATALAQDIGKKYEGTPKTMSGDSVTFDNLAQGVYLGVMTDGPKGLAVIPFVATLPSRDPETDELRYSYDVNVKVSYREPTPEPTTTPTETPTEAPTTPPDDQPEVPTTLISGEKVWEDENDLHGVRPEEITVQLYANGVLQNRTPTWSDRRGSRWSYSFGRLPAQDGNGRNIEYTVEELPVEGYTTQISGMTITNTLIPRDTEKFVDLTVTKIWNDNNNAQGIRPSEITVLLYRDDELYRSATVTAADGWACSFDELPEDDGYGYKYTYSIHENAVPGYYGRIEDGTKLINTPLYPDGGTVTRGGVPKGKVKPGTPGPKFGDLTEADIEELFDLFDYNTPLWGMLGTGDETPVWPYIFAGLGVVVLAALAALLLSRRERRRT